MSFTDQRGHLFITEMPIKHGGMTKSDKYVSITMLCKVDAYAEGQPPEFKKFRNALSLREHWYGVAFYFKA